MREQETILVVDDEPDLLNILERILLREGYKVITASGGQQALEIAAQRGMEIDLLVSDIVMPGMGGRELVWRAQSLYPHLRVIMLSGYAEADTALQMMEEAEPAVFLEKPVDLTEFAQVVRQVLDGHYA